MSTAIDDRLFETLPSPAPHEHRRPLHTAPRSAVCPTTYRVRRCERRPGDCQLLLSPSGVARVGIVTYQAHPHGPQKSPQPNTASRGSFFSRFVPALVTFFLCCSEHLSAARSNANPAAPPHPQFSLEQTFFLFNRAKAARGLTAESSALRSWPEEAEGPRRLAKPKRRACGASPRRR